MAKRLRFRHPLRRALARPRRRSRLVRRTPELPLPASDASAYPHMRYARTVPLHARGDFVACRRRASLVMAAAALDGLVIEPGRPFSLWRLLDRAGFMPTASDDLAPLATLLHEMAQVLDWRELERHAAVDATDELATVVRWPTADLRLAPPAGAYLLHVRVAGDGLQLAAYSAESFAREAS